MQGARCKQRNKIQGKMRDTKTIYRSAGRGKYKYKMRLLRLLSVGSQGS